MTSLLYMLLLFAQVKDVHFSYKEQFSRIEIATIDSADQWHWQYIDTLNTPKSAENLNSLYVNRLIGRQAPLHQYWDFYLDSTHRKFKILSDSLLKNFPHRPYHLRYVSEFRSLEKQANLLQKGKSKLPLSLHNFGFALDVGIYRGKKYLRRGPLYTKMGEKAKEIGLFWGGDFVGFPDPGHIQYFSNTAHFITQFPKVGFEFLRFKKLFEDNYYSAMEHGREAFVQDTKQLIDVLDQTFPETKRISQYAITFPENDSLRKWLSELKQPTYAIVYHPSAHWIYIHKGFQGYFWQVQ